jgi:rod shape-determining protein MreD
MPKKFELYFWSALPCLIALLLAVLVIVPKNIVSLGAVFPLLHLIPIYYWSVVHVRHMPMSFVIILGLLLDVITGVPLGVNTFSYTGFCLLIYSQRKFLLKEGFPAKWSHFAFTVGALFVGQWLLVGFLGGSFISIYNACIAWAFTALLYPFFHYQFHRLYEYSNYRRYKILHA